MAKKSEDLQSIYLDELADLWSANDQMQRVVKRIARVASDPALKEMLAKSEGAIAAHTETVKAIIEANDRKTPKEHCKGMEGLVEEAKTHVLEEGPDEGPLLDAVIITQYQRMTHYGIAGFGTAAAFAAALGKTDEQARLKEAVSGMYDADQYLTRLAETKVNVAAV